MENEIYLAVLELNQELFDKEIDEGQFYYTTTGSIEVVEFENIVLWCSENDEREFIEEIDNYEPFLPFIKKEFNNLVSKLNKLKF